MARTTGRIVISKHPKEQLELAKAVFNKHISEGGNSPLMSLQGVELALISSKIEPALEQHEIAEHHKKQMEQAYRQRDVALEEIMNLTRKSIKLLKAAFADNPKKLGEWGVNVDDSIRTKKTKEEKTKKE